MSPRSLPADGVGDGDAGRGETNPPRDDPDRRYDYQPGDRAWLFIIVGLGLLAALAMLGLLAYWMAVTQ